MFLIIGTSLLATSQLYVRNLRCVDFSLSADFSHSAESMVTSLLMFTFGLFIQVSVPAEVVDVACGVDHMVALAKTFL